MQIYSPECLNLDNTRLGPDVGDLVEEGPTPVVPGPPVYVGGVECQLLHHLQVGPGSRQLEWGLVRGAGPARGQENTFFSCE